jgi:hypothetical protein
LNSFLHGRFECPGNSRPLFQIASGIEIAANRQATKLAMVYSFFEWHAVLYMPISGASLRRRIVLVGEDLEVVLILLVYGGA